ncbi:hypothetical protein Purlil1_1492 [Purpureocillium lilacinum]|uniref:Uncharacterized protein n=1 Tax=Purpureocillium lilacinum TaxID=33203 RepID=A0ABR0CC77_PURLI|nr:hypothetical protein Purlil1_1492 [Purpureocillium lilacinum]
MIFSRDSHNNLALTLVSSVKSVAAARGGTFGGERTWQGEGDLPVSARVRRLTPYSPNLISLIRAAETDGSWTQLFLLPLGGNDAQSARHDRLNPTLTPALPRSVPRSSFVAALAATRVHSRQAIETFASLFAMTTPAVKIRNDGQVASFGLGQSGLWARRNQGPESPSRTVKRPVTDGDVASRLETLTSRGDERRAHGTLKGRQTCCEAARRWIEDRDLADDTMPGRGDGPMAAARIAAGAAPVREKLQRYLCVRNCGSTESRLGGWWALEEDKMGTEWARRYDGTAWGGTMPILCDAVIGGAAGTVRGVQSSHLAYCTRDVTALWPSTTSVRLPSMCRKVWVTSLRNGAGTDERESPWQWPSAPHDDWHQPRASMHMRNRDDHGGINRSVSPTVERCTVKRFQHDPTVRQPRLQLAPPGGEPTQTSNQSLPFSALLLADTGSEIDRAARLRTGGSEDGSLGHLTPLLGSTDNRHPASQRLHHHCEGVCCDGSLPLLHSWRHDEEKTLEPR